MDEKVEWATASGVNGNAGLDPVAASRRLRTLTDTENDWLCAQCNHRVASEKDRLLIGSQSEFAFTNPAGMPFVIVTFLDAPGCHDEGNPAEEHTWFPGYAWSYGTCERCGQQLGWCYTGPGDFVALIQSRIVRALNLFN